MTIKYIAISKLIVSPFNVRTVSANSQQDKELFASVKSQGLLQNLVVIATQEDETVFEVIAGGRRFSVLTKLCEESDISGDYEVPCLVKTRSDAVETSLSENFKADMHPADRFMAYKAMNDGGKSMKDISTHYGVPQAEVKKLLKLGSVAPSLIDLFKGGKLDLDCIMAFTVCDDQERQEACYKDLSRGDIRPSNIKSFLLGESVRSDSPSAKFIGLEEYKKVGGTVTADLFDTVSYLCDTALVNQLVQEKLDSVAEEYRDHWLWVEASTTAMQATFGLQQESGEPTNVPEELVKKIASYKNELEAFEQLDEDEYEAGNEGKDYWDEYYALDEKIDKLEENLVEYEEYTPEQRYYMGVIVAMNSGGELVIQKGMLKQEDVKRRRNDELRASGNDVDGQAPVTKKEVSGEPPAESKLLQGDLSNYHAQAFQAHMLKFEKVAFDTFVFGIADRILGNNYTGRHVSKIRCEVQSHEAVGIDETRSAEQIQQCLLALPLSWAKSDCIAERFTDFQKLNNKDKNRLLTFCICQSLAADLNGDRTLEKSLIEQTAFNIVDYWNPTVENYYSRVDKKVLSKIGAELGGDDFANNYVSAKKSELAKVVSELPKASGFIPKTLAG